MISTVDEDVLNKVFETLILAEERSSNTLLNNLAEEERYSNTLLNNLADIVCELLESSKDNVLYFSMPIWDYLKNTWMNPTVARVYSDNDKDLKDSGRTKSWVHENDPDFKKSIYNDFFKESQKNIDFSFIEFFTQRVTKCPPIYTIKFCENNIQTICTQEELCFSDSVLEKKFVTDTKMLLENHSNEGQHIESISEGCNNELNNLFQFLKLYKKKFSNIKYIYFISSRLFKKNNNAFIGSGGVILVCNGSIDDTILKRISVLTNLCYRELGGMNWAKRCELESIKSAIAAIMSRNMSHNLGSHFLANTKNFYKHRVVEIEKKEGFQDVCKEYRGNVAMLQYIQERMDFIATIVSGDQYPMGTLNFKSQLLDVLTQDDNGKDTINFLLKYLALSEGLTREAKSESLHELSLEVLYKDKDGTELIYTGKPSEKDKEKDVKSKLSKLCLALPGGLMARHAFYIIIENLIRNTAKHTKVNNDLVFVIRLENIADRTLNFTLYSDCEDPEAATKINQSLRELRILKPDNSINKENKGLKEILMCLLWLKGKDVAQELFEIQNTPEGDARLAAIENTGVQVSPQDGKLCYTFSLPLFEPYHILKENEDYNITDEKISLNIDKIKEVHADVIVANVHLKEQEIVETVQTQVSSNPRKLSDIFPRCYFVAEGDIREDEVVNKYYDQFSNYSIYVDVDDTTLDNPISNVIFKNVNTGKCEQDCDIIFKDHFHNWSNNKKIGYLECLKSDRLMESISGANYISTICTNEFLKDVILKYKLIEAMKAKIVLMDERLFNYFAEKEKHIIKLPENSDSNSLLDYLKNLKAKNKTIYDHFSQIKGRENVQKDIANVNSQECLNEYIKKFNDAPCLDLKVKKLTLERKNVFLYDFNSEYTDIVDLLGENVGNRSCDFLSIHLGLVEKYIENYINTKKKKDNNETRKDDEIRNEAVAHFLCCVKEKLGPKFLTFHSGRGNLSPELEKTLAHYPFISLSSLESAFDNCKYFLSEMFYHTNYYGKGSLNYK